MAEALINGKTSSYSKIEFDNYSLDPIKKVYCPSFGTRCIWQLAAAHVEDYAVFSGGYKSGIDVPDAYNSSLVKFSFSTFPLSQTKRNLAATNIDDCALFGGGENTGDDSVSADVVSYNSSLTRSTPTSLSVARTNLAATHIGNSYALFAGGWSGEDITAPFDSTVDVYDSSLTRLTELNLPQDASDLAATHISSYALFGGGQSPIVKNIVSCFNSNLTRSILSGLTNSKRRLAATHVGNYAIFGGGEGYGEFDSVDAYNTSLVKTSPTALSEARYDLAATHVNDDFAFFAGGRSNLGSVGGVISDTVDAYNPSLVRRIPERLMEAKELLAGTHTGNYALFGGPLTVDAYTTITGRTIQIYPGDKYKLNSMDQEQTASDFTRLNLTFPINGYIKRKSQTLN